MPSRRMIFFVCPECEEEMEVSRTMIGRKVECVGCGEKVTVPKRSDEPPEDEGMTAQEWWLYGILFVLIPAANVFISSILYYVWKSERPKKAGQINMLGFLIFLFHVMIGGLIVILRSQ